MPSAAIPCKHLPEPPLSAKVALGRFMRRVVKEEFSGEVSDNFWSAIANDTLKPRAWLKEVYDNLEQLDEERKLKNLGLEVKSTRIKIGSARARNFGKRATGAGRRNYLLPMWVGVKQWFLHQRENGCFVDKHDLFLELGDRVHISVDKLQAHRATGKPISRVEHEQLRAAKLHIKSTTPDSKHYAKNKQNRLKRLMDFIGCRLCRPQRLVDLSKSEEMHRLHQTWKLIDERLSLCAFGSEQDLRGHVGDPDAFMQGRKHLVVLQSDQMPVYALLRPSEQLYAAHERRREGKKSDMSVAQKEGAQSGGHSRACMHPLDEVERKQEATSSTQQATQKRGTEHAGQDKHRITVELVHEIHHWLDSSKQPVGRQGKHLVVLSGVHADLSNIGPDHRFIESKRFWVAGKPMEHIKGEKTTLMHNIVKLREQSTETLAIVSKLHVMQQPSGFVDQTIQKWHVEHQAKQYPVSVCIRDLLTGAYCDKSRLVMAVSQQVCSWIWGKMTPVCQLTDTTAARPFKLMLHKHQIDLRQELRAKHAAEGSEVSFKCGHYELLRLVSRSADDLSAFMDGQEQRAIRDSVSNGLLAYRPNLETGKLEKTVDQDWAKALGLKVGNHRMDEDWVSDRYNWLSAEGKPVGPTYEDAKSLVSDELDDPRLRSQGKPIEPSSEPKPSSEGKPSAEPSSDGKPINEPSTASTSDKLIELEQKLHKQLNTMVDVEYEAKKDFKPEESRGEITVRAQWVSDPAAEITFDSDNFAEEELNDAILSSRWITYLSLPIVKRHRTYDKLLQHQSKPKAKAPPTSKTLKNSAKEG